MKALHLATAKKGSYRPAMEYIQLLNGHFYATDANILIKIPFYEVIPRALYEELTAKYGEEMYFKGEDWKNSKMEKGCIFKLLPESNLIQIFDNKKSIGTLEIISAPDFSKIATYPNCENILYKDDIQGEKMDLICFNPDLLSNLYYANGKKFIKLAFYGTNKMIRVYFKESEAYGVLMPMLNF